MFRRLIFVQLVFMCLIAYRCSDSRTLVKRSQPNGEEIVCVQPPKDVVSKETAFRLEGKLPKIIDIVKAEISVERKVERIRAETQGVQAFEIIEYRLCMAHANGLIDATTYKDFLKDILPKLFAKIEENNKAQKSTLPDTSQHPNVSVSNSPNSIITFNQKGSGTTVNREALEAESRPFLSRLFINRPTAKEVGVWIENQGKGVAHLTPYDIVINGDRKSKHNIQTLDDWKTVLTRLGINHPWVNMAAIRGRIVIAPGNKFLVLRMTPSEFSSERYQQFIEALDGMEFLLSYKSSTGKEFTFSFDDLNGSP